MSIKASKAPYYLQMALGIAALTVALTGHAAGASAQCNPVNRVSEAHIPPDPPPRDRIDAIFNRLRATPQLYDLLGCPVDYFGTAKDFGAFINFDRGAMYAPPGRGAVEIHGAIREKWAEYRWELGRLGYPISDEQSFRNDPERRFSQFEGGIIFWSSGYGAHAIYGAIGDAFPRRNGRLAPVNEEFSSPGGQNNCPRNHRQQNFANLEAFGLVQDVACWDANTGRVTWFSFAIPIEVPTFPTGGI